MERSLFRFALWGGRRLHITYVPPKPRKDSHVPVHKKEVPLFDWTLAHHGILYTPTPTNETRVRGKRTR